MRKKHRSLVEKIFVRSGDTSMMKYKGYFGNIMFDDEAEVFHGEVIGIRDVVTFQGTTAEEIKKAFHESVDVYLEWCKKKGEKPEKTFSGKLNLRMPPELHAQLSSQAQISGMSLNAFIVEKLRA